MLSLFLTHLKGLKKEAIKSPVYILAEVVLELLLPLIMSEIVDVAIPAGDTNRIFVLGGLMVVVALAAMTCGVLSAKYATYASQGFGANLRQALFDKVQEFSFADIDRFSSASLITRMTNDVNALTVMLNMSLRMLFRAPAMLLFALCISFSINNTVIAIAMITKNPSVWLISAILLPTVIITRLEKVKTPTAIARPPSTAVRRALVNRFAPFAS